MELSILSEFHHHCSLKMTRNNIRDDSAKVRQDFAYPFHLKNFS